MADSPSSSFSDFGVLLYLEELDNEELNKFKLLLKDCVEPGQRVIPWAAVKKANREELANLVNKYYPGEEAWKVVLRIFSKMNLKDLYRRAKAEINWKTQTVEPEVAEVEVASAQEAVIGDGTDYKMKIKEHFCIIRDKSSLVRDPPYFHNGIFQKNRKLLENVFDADIRSGQQPRTVVLQGAAGVGKTTLMKKVMFDWAEGNLYQHRFSYVFYLRGREMSQLREKSFAQLLSTDWPSTEVPIERVLSHPSSLLFIIDSFDELNFAFEEPEFALCKDWTQVHPVSFLLSSLLRKVLLPTSCLLVTTRLTASKRLKPLLKNAHYVDLHAMSKDERMEYAYQFFLDATWATEAIRLIRNNETLFSMCEVPTVCQVICTCLKEQMEKGADITGTCQTTTAVFTCYISSLFSSEGNFSSLPNETQLRSLCHLAAEGLYTMAHVIYRDNLRKHGLTSFDISIFLDANILQKDTQYENCYVFNHLHVQEFFGAMFYLLRTDWVDEGRPLHALEDLNLLLQSKSYRDPHLTQMKCFLFGLLNEDRVKQLEETLNCKISPNIKWELLQCMRVLGTHNSSLSQLVFLDLFHYLYETRDESFVAKAMSYFSKIVVDIYEETHLLEASFCVRPCRCLQSIKLTITMVNSSAAAEPRQTDGDRTALCWQNLFSVLHTNGKLTELDLSYSNFDELTMKNFYDGLTHPNCKVKTLLLNFVSFPDGHKDIFGCLTHNQNLRHLDLKASDIEDNGVKSLCEALKHSECKLQNLRLESCNLTAICCLNLSKALIRSQSLVFLNLSTNSLLDDGVKLLCEALRHPKCHLERLSLESCGLTAVGCEDLSLALISNKRLTHLCLADNNLGDSGIKLLSDALRHPQCNLQSLVLRYCHFSPRSGEYLSASLLHNKSLTHLDLSSNRLQDDGVKLLCNVFWKSGCNLRDMELMGCVLTSACCLDLVSIILNSPTLLSLDLGDNDLRDEGVKILCEALRHPNCNIQKLGLDYCGLTSVSCKDLSSVLLSNERLIKMNLTQNNLGREGLRSLCEVLRFQECKLQVLGLCKDAFDAEAQKLLEAVGVSNPNLVIKPTYKDNKWVWWKCF
ncbi:NACHT, LRR and PYD domains-containing protein 14 [Ctenodactylus gundi]